MRDTFRFGLKVPDLDWFWKYNLNYEQAVEKLKFMGVDFVMCHNHHLPGIDTAVPGEVPMHMQYKMELYDEMAFREALRAADIAYIGQAGFGFDEKMMKELGNVSIDQYGKRIEKIDWYIGACPTCKEYVDARLEMAEAAMKEFEMDGIFVGFMRYPGFWELWLPETDGEAWSEYCFCERCLKQFEEYAGIQIPVSGELTAGQWIRENAREEWTRFKCQIIHDIVARYRAVVKKYNPEGKIILNTVPFDKKHYGDYGKMIFGQDPELLADVVDIFEIMGYHQILGMPYQWIGEAGEYFKNISGKRVVCTVQGKALYTEGMHAGKGRRKEITMREFEHALLAIKNADVDGAIVFTWSDFLYKEYIEHDDSATRLVHRLFGEGCDSE